MAILSSNGVALAAPTELKIDDEIIWSSNTGRVSDGTMVGDWIAEKKTLSLTWEYLQESEVLTIRKQLSAGYFPVTFHDDGLDLTITSYRGTLSKDCLGPLGDGIVWYKKVTVKIIQQ